MNKLMSVSIEPDADGFIGRECPICEEYFKVKFGTGLSTQHHICPYCNHQGSIFDFHTTEQIEYAQSVVVKKAMEPILGTFRKSLKKLETSTRGGPIQIKVKTGGNPFKIKTYQEKILETNVTCDSCGLEFSIFGVFSNCPDCKKLNAKVIFEKSVEASQKRLELSEDEALDSNLREELLKDALLGVISSFDSLGKALRNKHNTKFPSSPKNLFQNFLKLDAALKSSFNKNIKDYLSQTDSDFLFEMFQVRHIYEHNAGVIDDDFIDKLSAFSSQKNKKYKLKKSNLEFFLTKIAYLMDKIYGEVE